MVSRQLSLKAEPMGFAGGLDVVCERKRGVGDDPEDFVLSNFKGRVDIS